MRYCFDTEFVEDGKTIDLISIAIVAEDGREYYAVSTEFNQRRARKHAFVREHVLPHLPLRWPSQWDSPRLQHESDRWKSRKQIAAEVREFVGEDPVPEFWAHYAAYDWVALCQLYGPMVCLPAGWPMFCRDTQQLKHQLNAPKFEYTNDNEHNALSDARECAEFVEFLLDYQARGEAQTS